jgi:uncharacterized protein YbjT (DUF2867 family)
MTKKDPRPMTESTLIVGATGAVGSELVRQFAATGRRVKALVRDEGKAASIVHLAAPVIGDLAAPATLERAFKGAERVFVLSPPIPEMELLDRNAFDAAIAAGAKRIVFLSNYGAGEFGDDDWRFQAHAANERRLASLGVDWTILRPTRFMNYTPYVWGSVFQRNLLLEGGGEGAMTVIDPADIAAVALLALTKDGHEGKTYDLTSEDSFTALQLAKMLSQALGRDLGHLPWRYGSAARCPGGMRRPGGLRSDYGELFRYGGRGTLACHRYGGSSAWPETARLRAMARTQPTRHSLPRGLRSCG